MYILRHRPVSDPAFEAHMRFGYRNGYSSNHLSFVCRDRHTKTEHRFSTRSGRLWRSVDGPWEQVPLGSDLAATLAQVSGLPYAHLSAALDYLERQSVEALER
jgi:hypothetical protein